MLHWNCLSLCNIQISITSKILKHGFLWLRKPKLYAIFTKTKWETFPFFLTIFNGSPPQETLRANTLYFVPEQSLMVLTIQLPRPPMKVLDNAIIVCLENFLGVNLGYGLAEASLSLSSIWQKILTMHHLPNYQTSFPSFMKKILTYVLHKLC